MPFRVVLMFLLAALISAPGCCVSEKTKIHIDTQIAAHEGYERLINETLAGELTGDQAKGNISAEDLKATPAPVKALLERTFQAIHKSKLSYITLEFTLGEGPDPDTLILGEAPTLPSGADGILEATGPGDGE